LAAARNYNEPDYSGGDHGLNDFIDNFLDPFDLGQYGLGNFDEAPYLPSIAPADTGQQQSDGTNAESQLPEESLPELELEPVDLSGDNPGSDISCDGLVAAALAAAASAQSGQDSANADTNQDEDIPELELEPTDTSEPDGSNADQKTRSQALVEELMKYRPQGKSDEEVYQAGRELGRQMARKGVLPDKEDLDLSDMFWRGFYDGVVKNNRDGQAWEETLDTLPDWLPFVEGTKQSYRVEKIQELEPTLQEHLQKMRDQPSSQDFNKWRAEADAYLRRMEKYLDGLKGKTRDDFTAKINSYREQLRKLTGG
jgi:hypothetical protein